MAANFELKAILSVVDRISPALKNVQAVAKNARKYLGDIGSASSNLAGKIGLPSAALAGLVSGGIVSAATRAVKDFASTGAALDDMSKRTGLTTDQLQLLSYQGEMADVSIEMLQNSLGKLQQNMGAALAGKNKELAGLFKYLGISMRGADGRARSVADLLPELADKFQETNSQVKRARMGMTLFGKSYADILPMLVDGRAGLDKSAKEWGEIGFKLSPQDVENAANLDDSFVKLRRATDGLFVSLGAKLSPVVSPFIDRLIKWGAAQRDIADSELNKVIDDLGTFLKGINFDDVAKGVRNFIKDTRELVDSLGGVKTILIGLGVLMAAGPLVSMIELTAAVGRLSFAFVGASANMLSFIGLQTPLQAMSASMTATNATAASLVGTIGKLSAVAGVAAAGIAGWEIGTFLNDKVINPLVTKLTGVEGNTLGSWIYDVTHQDEIAALNAPTPLQPRESLVTAGMRRFGGSMTVDFRNAPTGMRITDKQASRGFDLDAAVGYNGFALDRR